MKVEEKVIRTGDRVYHEPSEETWIVAWVEDERLYWLGYPFGGYAKLRDCKLIDSCSDEQHQERVADLAKMANRDHHLSVIRCREIIRNQEKIEAAKQREISINFASDDFQQLFNNLCKDVHGLAVDKGWYDPPKSFPEAIALIHSELSEALEADRKQKGASEKIPEFDQVTEELADCIIRIMDTAAFMDLDLGAAIVAKMRFNEGRSHKHGELKY